MNSNENTYCSILFDLIEKQVIERNRELEEQLWSEYDSSVVFEGYLKYLDEDTSD